MERVEGHLQNVNIIQCKALTMYTEDQCTPHIKLELCIDSFIEYLLLAIFQEL